MKKIVFGAMLVAVLLSFTGCGQMPQHIGTIPKDIVPEEAKSFVDKSRYSEITCAEGETQTYYVFPFFIGWSTPTLELEFDDEGFSLFKSKYKSVKLAPAKRDFTLKFSYKDKRANVRVKQFDFEPNTKYFAKYSALTRSIRVWIEKEDGTVVYGKKPEEGTF